VVQDPRGLVGCPEQFTTACWRDFNYRKSKGFALAIAISTRGGAGFRRRGDRCGPRFKTVRRLHPDGSGWAGRSDEGLKSPTFMAQAIGTKEKIRNDFRMRRKIFLIGGGCFALLLILLVAFALLLPYLINLEPIRDKNRAPSSSRWEGRWRTKDRSLYFPRPGSKLTRLRVPR